MFFSGFFQSILMFCIIAMKDKDNEKWETNKKEIEILYNIYVNIAFDWQCTHTHTEYCQFPRKKNFYKWWLQWLLMINIFVFEIKKKCLYWNIHTHTHTDWVLVFLSFRFDSIIYFIISHHLCLYICVQVCVCV